MTLGLLVFALGSPGQAWAATLPSGATVVHGAVDLQQQGNDALRILQGSQSAIVNWQSFDIGANALVDIVQPNIDSALLSRIVGGNPSEILGSLNANGHLFLVNPNGIIFGKDSTVDVHALIASTLDIADSAFLSGNISFTGDSEAAVINLGSINAKSFAALVGGKVSNAGSITSSGGDAALLAADATLEVGEAAGGKITLDLSGLLGGTAENSGSIDVASSSTTQGGSATILGEQVAVSGTVDASGATGGGLVRIGGDYQGQNANLANAQSTNISGTISADSSSNGDGGRIIVWADGVTTFTGDLSATGSGSGSGGFAEVSGKNVLNFEGSVDLTSASGVTGSLLLDPTNISISNAGSHTSISGSTTLEPSAVTGSVISLSTLNTALGSSNVIIQTSAGGGSEMGNVSVGMGLAVTGSNDLTIIADGDVTMISGSINLGAGDLSVTAGNTRADGTILLFSSITAGDLVLVADDAISVTGAVDLSAGGGTISGTLSQSAGPLTVNNITTPVTVSATTNNGNVIFQGSGNISLNSISAGTGQVSVTSTAGSVIDHASDSIADITADTIILSAATGIGTSAAVELASATSISATSAGSGNIDIDHVADASTSITTIAQTGTGNVLFDQTGSQALAITNNATTAGGNLTLTTDGTLALAVTSVTGDMSLTSSGAITDTGTITVSGTTTLASGAANNITFDTASNNFGTVVITNGNNVTLVDTNAIALGASTVGGNLSVTGGGAITDSGVLTVTGTSSFAAGANAITLDLANDFGGAVSLSNSGSNNVIIDDANNLALGTVTVGGDFTVDNAGTITQSGVVTVSGNTVLDNQDGTNAAITLANGSNAFTGTVTFTTDTGSNVSLTDTTALDLQSGLSVNDLVIVAGGAITQSGALTVAGTSSFTAGTNAITLTQAANDFTGAVSLSNSGSNDVGVTDANAIDLGTVGVGQNLAVTASGAITDTGVATVAGTSTFDNSGGSDAAIDLGSASTYTGDVTFTTDTGSDVTISDSTAFVVQSGLNVNNLNLTAGGTVTDAGNIDIDGTLTVSAAGQTVTLDGAGNDVSGNVTLTGAAVTLVDTTATLIAGITATGALSVTTGGAITQSGAIDADLTSSFTANGNAITLTQPANDFTGAVSLSNSGGNAVQLTDANALDLGTVGVGQNLTITAIGGALTDSGNVTVAGVATIVSTGQTVTLGDSTTANFGSLDFAGDAVTITEGSAMEVAASEATGALALEAGGAITQTGAIDADSTSSFTAGANAITLTEAGNDFTGAVSLSNSGSNDVGVTDANAIDLGTIGVGQNLSVTASGAITDTGVATVAGTSTFDNNGGSNAAIDLGSASTYTGDVTFTTDTGSDVTINDSTAFAIQSGLNVNNLNLTAGGTVTDAGNIDIDGTLTVSAAGQTVTLDGAGNDLTGNVTLTGAAVTLVDTTATAIAGITATGALGVTSGGAITQSGVITNDGQTATLDAGTNAITLDQSNDFGTLDVNGAVTNLAVTDVDDIILAAVTTSGTLQVTAGGAVSDSGTIVAGGATTISNAGATVILDEAANNFAAIGVTGTTVTLVDTNGIDLAATTATGALSVTAGGDIIDSGVITNDGQTATLDAGTNAITLDQSSDFGTLDVNGAVTNLAVTDVDDIIVAAVTTSGTLQVTAGGAVSDSGTIVAGGATTISNAGATVILDEAANNFAAIGVTGTTVTLVDTNGIDLAATTATGALSVTAGGAVSDSGTIVAGGATTISNAGATVILDEAANNFAAIGVTGTTVTLVDTNGIDLAATTATGALSVTAGGDIIDSGVITNDGQTATLDAGTNAITLDQSSDFGTLDVNGAVTNLAVTDVDDIILAAVTTSGTLQVTAGGAVSDSGTIVAGGATTISNAGATVILDEAANNFAAIGVTGTTVTLVDTNGIDLAATTATGALSVTAGGDIIDSGVITNDGQTATLDAGANAITLDQSSDFGTLDVNGAVTNLAVTDVDDIILAAVTTSGTLQVTAGGAVSDSGTIVAGGATTISNAGATVILDEAANNFAAIGVTGTTVTLVDTNGIDLAATTATGALSVTAGGDIIDSGVITNDGQTATLDAGANAITLDQSSDFGTLDVNGAVTNLAVTDVDDIILAAVTTSGTLQVTAGGAVSDSGTIVAGGATTISNAGATVILDEAANNFAAIGVTGTTVTLVDTNGIDLAATTATGALSVTAGGDIIDSGVITNDGQTATLDAGANAITLDQSSDFGTLDVNGAVTNLAVTDVDDIILAAVTTSGTLQVTAGGAVSDSGTIVAGGATTISNAGATVILDEAANNFAAIGVTGTTVTLVDTNGIDLAATTATGALSVTAGGAVSDSGTIVAGGATTISNAGATVILDEAANNFAAIGVTGTTVTLVDTNGIDLAATTATGALSVTAGGDIIDSGVITNDGQTATLDAGANAITLDQSSDFGTLDVNGAVTNLAVTDVDDIILAAVTTSGTLQVTAGGAVSDSGTIVAGGATTISNAGATVILDEAANNFAAIGVTGTTVTLVDTNGIDLAATTATGALSVTAGGDIIDSGVITNDGQTATLDAGTNAITLDQSSDFGTLDVNGAVTNLAVTDVDDIILAAVTTSGTLQVTAGGAVSDSGTIVAGGATTISNAGATVILDEAANNFAAIGVTGTTVTLVDTNGIDLAATTATGALSVTAGGAVSDSGTIVAGGATTISNAGATVILDEAANNFAAIGVTGTTVTLVDTNGIDLAATTATGALSVTAGGDIIDSGVITNDGQTATLDAGANAITLDQSSDFGTLDVNGAVTNLAVTDVDDIILAAVTTSGTLQVTAGGAVSDSGTIVAGGATTISNAGATVILDEAANNFAAIGVTGTTVTLVDTNGIDLAATTATGALSVTAGGDIIDSGVITNDGQTATLDAGTNAITLDQSSDFGTLDVNGAVTNLAVTDVDDIILAAVTTSGTLQVTAGGAVSDSGTIVAGGATTISNAGATVILDEAANNFAAIGVTGTTVTLVDTNGIDLAATTATGALSVTAGGDIIDSGVITNDGQTATLDAGANAITLDQSSDFGTLDVNGAVTNLAVTDVDDIIVAAVTTSGTLQVTAGGAVSDSGTIVAGGATTISNAGATVILDEAANNFAAIGVTGTTVTLVDTNGIDLAATTATGALSVTAGGAVSDSGTIVAGGATTISNAGATVILDEAANNFAAIGVTGTTVTLVDTNGIDLAATTATGALSVTAGGDIIDSGVITNDGQTATLDAGANAITLDQSSDFGTLDVNGAVTNLAVTDVDDIILAAVTTSGTLQVTAGGAVSDSGTIVAKGRSDHDQQRGRHRDLGRGGEQLRRDRGDRYNRDLG